MLEKDGSVSALLDLAADLMEEHGWQTGDYFQYPGGTNVPVISEDARYRGGMMCTEGAIRAAGTLLYVNPGQLSDDDRYLFRTAERPAVHGAMDAVRSLVPAMRTDELPGAPIVRSIPWWNDTVCCSKDEAVSVLRDAATKTRPDS